MIDRGGAISEAWRTMLDFGASPDDPPEQREVKRIIVAVLWVSLPATSVWIVLNVVQGAPLAGVVLAAVGVLSLIVLTVIRAHPGRFSIAIQFAFLGNNLGSLAQTLLFGGLLASGLNMVWAFLGVLGALIVFGYRAAAYWLGAFVFSSVLGVIVPNFWDGLYTLDNAAAIAAGNLVTVMLAVFLVLVYFIRQRDRFQRESDDLLRNILPEEIAARLKTDTSMIADDFPEASVLFADVVEFTPMSAKMTPPQLVGLLNSVFTTFDEFVAELGLEKIKTVGDEYMVAAGVPIPRPDHAVAIADLALRFRDFVAIHDFDGNRLQLRIGIHSGPVVAGIIGTHKFSYDLWGDTVNTASRMESAGTPGQIQVTAATRELLAGNGYTLEPRGTIEVKGKGPMQTWLLVGPSRSG